MGGGDSRGVQAGPVVIRVEGGIPQAADAIYDRQMELGRCEACGQHQERDVAGETVASCALCGGRVVKVDQKIIRESHEAYEDALLDYRRKHATDASGQTRPLPNKGR